MILIVKTHITITGHGHHGILSFLIGLVVSLEIKTFFVHVSIFFVVSV